MRKTSLLILLALTGCYQSSQLKILQIDYQQNGETKTLFLNVKETSPYQFEVISQEWIDENPDFVILDIFDYAR